MKSKSLKFGLVGIALVTATQLSSCGAATVGTATRYVLTTLGTEVIIECTLDDCFAKSAQAAEGADKPSLAESIQNYYALINQSKYEEAWTYLSPDFQAKIEEKGGYKAYSEWWSTIDAVSVKNLEIVEGAEDQVHIDANLKYFRQENKDFTHVLRLSLIWDSQNNRWAINSSEIIK